MLKLKEGIKVFVSTVAVDARKSIDGLSGLVQELFGNNPQFRREYRLPSAGLI